MQRVKPMYKAKLDLFNTTCTILIYNIGKGSEGTRMGGFTIAEFFYHTFFKTVLNAMLKRYDKKHINNFCREMASFALYNLCQKDVCAMTAIKK